MMARLLRGILANGYGQAVTILGQVACVPVLLHAWGGERYGIWVLLTAVPAVLAFADGGFAIATGNAMAMAVAAGEAGRAGALYRNLRRQSGITVVTLAVMAGLLLACLPASAFAVLAPLDPLGARMALACISAVVLLGVLGNVPGVAFRAGGHYAWGVVAASTLRLVESGAVLLVAALGGDLLAAASGWLAIRAAGVAGLLVLTAYRQPWTVGKGAVPVPDLHALLPAALASLALPAGLALGLQGVTVALGLALPPTAVALFAATRTLARASVQAAGLLNHALMPEMSRLAGRGETGAMLAMTRWNTLSSFALLVTGWLATLVAGPPALSVWTDGRLGDDRRLLALVATATLLHGVWLGRANLLLAVNRQAECAWVFLAVAVATAGFAWPAARLAGLDGVGALLVAGEAAMVFWLWRPRRRAVGWTSRAVAGSHA